MRAYMKSELPFYGVQKPARDRVLKEVFAEHPPASQPAQQAGGDQEPR